MADPASTPLEDLLASEKLPSPSGVALRILELTRDADTSLEELQQVLLSDPALAGRVLHYANSAQVCGGREVRTVADAVVRLGMRTLRQVALTFSLLAGARSGPCPHFDYNGFWSRSLAVAVGAQSLAGLVSRVPPEEAFTCGLLARLGQLALASVHPRSYGEVLARWDGLDVRALAGLEREALVVDHDEVTGALLAHWGLPVEYGTAITAQADLLTRPDPEAPGLARVLAAAHALAEVCVATEASRAPLAASLLDHAAALGLPRDRAAAAVDTALAEWARMGEVLDIITEDLPSLAELSARGQDAPAAPLAETEEPADLQEALDQLAGSPVDADPLRILVVDDSPLDVKIVTAQLRKEGHEVATAADGAEGLERALRWNPHIIISDWMMPRVDGLELCRALRRAENASHVYVMMMTSNDQQDDLITALEAGADDYLSKPVNHAELRARLRAGARVVRLQERAARDHEAIQASNAQLSVVNRKLRHLALYDQLTNLPNRRYAMDRLEKEWQRARRHGTPLVCMLLDIDHFKRVNDTHGHDAGDVVLQHTARAMQDCLRSSDDVCRFGGEEFLAICPGADVDLAQELADRLRRAVADNQIEAPEFSGRVTVSVGVSGTCDQIDSITEMLKLADEGLYAAKEAGRNKVCIVGHESAV
jgi:diguanylate cyclase (GGDEF)-like protein